MKTYKIQPGWRYRSASRSTPRVSIFPHLGSAVVTSAELLLYERARGPQRRSGDSPRSQPPPHVLSLARLNVEGLPVGGTASSSQLRATRIADLAQAQISNI